MTAPSTFHEEEALAKGYDARLMRRLLAYARPHRAVVSGAIALLMLEGLLQLAGPMLTQYVIDVAIPARDVALAWRAGFLMIGTLLLSFFCSYGEAMLTALLGQRVMQQMRVDIFSHLQRLPVTFYDRNPVGRLVTRVTSDVEALNDLFTSGVVAGLGDLFTLVAIGGLMFGTDWRLTLWSFAVIPLIYLTSHVFQRAVRTAYRDIRTKLARINAFLHERLTGMRLVQLFGMQRAERQSFETLNRDHLDAHLKSITYYALYFPAIEILSSVALAVLIVAGARRVEIGSLTVGTVAAFIQLSRRFYQPLQDLSDKFNILQQAMASSERVFRLLDEPAGSSAVASAPASALAPISAPPPVSLTLTRVDASRGITVRFEDVWFAYDRPHAADGVAVPVEPEWVLKGVSFEARPGRTLALVGHTGAGKSTIVNLLLRFYDPQRGRITVNDVDVRLLDVDALRSLIGYVQQDIFLFAGDVLTNIRLSAALTEPEVVAAAEQVGADRLVGRLAGGYAQHV